MNNTEDETATTLTSAGPPRGLFTRRAVALIVVVLLLMMSYGTSLRTWFETEQANAANRESIARSQEQIDELNAELARWDDPAFVRAQARTRLGWVVPGETGYRVLDADGQPIGQHLDRPGFDPGAPEPQTWWERMWGSIQAADEPIPEPGSPQATPEPKPPITDGTRTPSPSPTPTPKRTATPTPRVTTTPTPRRATATPTSSARPTGTATPRSPGRMSG
ncbi:FtsB family cell division protein [Granulicoccus sp. GXG6511]|uniref:FtsB family cell division protein n=1 Tax=Granulicoccus sp. GXG6511 TaxID=3381351 RepID=UPI003D7EB3E0